jgi:hypothetical protein
MTDIATYESQILFLWVASRISRDCRKIHLENVRTEKTILSRFSIFV